MKERALRLKVDRKGAVPVVRRDAALRLLARGHSNRQIAELLFVSTNTVSSHLRHIFAKTSVCNRTEAAAFAFDQGIM